LIRFSYYDVTDDLKMEELSMGLLDVKDDSKSMKAGRTRMRTKLIADKEFDEKEFLKWDGWLNKSFWKANLQYGQG
jgi:hypothetical protein